MQEFLFLKYACRLVCSKMVDIRHKYIAHMLFMYAEDLRIVAHLCAAAELALKARREIADYIAAGKEDRARIRVSQVTG